MEVQTSWIELQTSWIEVRTSWIEPSSLWIGTPSKGMEVLTYREKAPAFKMFPPIVIFISDALTSIAFGKY
ncbi:MAG TPA: hypothetical protein VIH57_07600 [Bacteroidales bacterium]